MPNPAFHDEHEIAMFGCTIAEMRTAIEDTMDFKFSGPGAVALSLLSDAQEEIARDLKEHARQTINRAKWVIRTYWAQGRVPS